MNAITQPQTLITCETTEEHSHAVPSTTIITSSTPCGELPHNPTQVQGVSGAVYAPMDTSPIQAKPISRLDELTTLLNETLKQIVIELTNSKDQQTDLEKAVDVALHNADWFDQRLEEFVGNHINDMDLDYEIGNQVERYMRNTFDPNDHVDFNDLVNDRVDDVIDDIVADKVYDYLDNNLDSLLKERLQNANITINF